jgi:hypothetical protein
MRCANCGTMSTGGKSCGHCNAPLVERPVNPNIVPFDTPRNWWVVSSLGPDGLAAPVLTFGAGIVFGQGFEVDVPANYALWKLWVNYTSVDPLAVGMIQLGANNPPIRVLANVPFELDTASFPPPLCGPLQVLIRGGTIPGDPVTALPVTFHAIVGELS